VPLNRWRRSSFCAPTETGAAVASGSDPAGGRGLPARLTGGVRASAARCGLAGGSHVAAAQARRAARLLLGCGTAGPGPRGRRAGGRQAVGAGPRPGWCAGELGQKRWRPTRQEREGGEGSWAGEEWDGPERKKFPFSFYKHDF
jgi:hypothetical protein